MAKIYGVEFYGDEIEVTITKNAVVVNDWILETMHIHRRRLHKLLVGLDIEWLPCFNPEENHPVALLQLCVGRRCLLFQLLHKDGLPGFLAKFLGDPNVKFVGVGVKGDAEKLLRDHKLFVANTVDLNRLALSIYGEEVYGKMGLKRMAKEVLGKVMEKPLNVTLSGMQRNWCMNKLNMLQLMLLRRLRSRRLCLILCGKESERSALVLLLRGNI